MPAHRSTPLALFAALLLAACHHPAPTPGVLHDVDEEHPVSVASPARDNLLAVGDPVPRFRALAQDGHVIDVAPGPRAAPLVVYFYPRDGTPG